MGFQIQNYTIGSDFELMIREKNTRNLVSAIGLIGGTKEQPLSIDNDCFRQEDGVNAEFNIPPVSSKKDWLKYIKYCIKKTNEEILPDHLVLSPGSSDFYSDEQLKDPKAREFGCSVSYDAWTEMPIPKPNSNTNLRSAGFHVHIGFTCTESEPFIDEDIYRLIRTLDVFLGVPSILIDQDENRRKLYGMEGEHRIKVNSVGNKTYLLIPEYRVLGSALLADNSLIEWVFNQTQRAIEEFNNGFEIPGAIIKDCINNNMKETARNICEEYNIDIPEIEVFTDAIIYKNSKLILQ